MSQNLTERFNNHVKSIRSKFKKPNVSVYHERNADGTYTGTTRCIIAYLDKNGPRSIVTVASVYHKETEPVTKSRGHRIATERAYKRYLEKVGE